MRIGIVSDVHGNASGLACALDRMGKIDRLLCTGDMVEEFVAPGGMKGDQHP